MYLKSILFASFAFGLAACGGGGSDGSVTNNIASFTTAFPPNVRDGVKTEYAELENGIVVYMGGRDGSVSEFRVRIDRRGTADSNDDILFVEQDGGPARAFEVIRVDFDNGVDDLAVTGRADNGDLFDVSTENALPVSATDTDPIVLRTSFINNPGPDQINGFGGGGLETAVSDLPSSAMYQGEYSVFSATSDLEIIGGAMMNVDFDNGLITGTHSGDMDIGRVSGDIDGAVSGSRVIGTMDVTGDATGTLNFGGAITGPGGARISLGIGGTVDAGSGPETLGGTGLLFQPFR